MMLGRHPLRNGKFLVIGRAGMDLYAHPVDTRTREAEQFVACLGGSSANIAVAIAVAGGSSSLLTTLSDDAVGWFCESHLTRYGVDESRIRRVGEPYRTSLAVIESRTEDQQTVLYRGGAADFQLTRDDVAPIDFAHYGAVVITGTCFAASPSREASHYAIERAKAAGIPVVIDLDYRPYSWPSTAEAHTAYDRAARVCDVVVGNDMEFDMLAGQTHKGASCAQALAQTTTALVIYKMGAKGSLTLSGETIDAHGTFPVQAIKPTGAGDAFLGNVLASAARGRTLADCIRHGSAAAAIVVSRVGCAPAMPTHEALESFIARTPEAPSPIDTPSEWIRTFPPGS